MKTKKPTVKPAQVKAIHGVLQERVYQENKWPGHKHTPAEWLLILRKLQHDAERAWVTGHGDDSALHEVRQIAATALACLEQCGCPLRGDKPKGRKYPGPHPHHSYDQLNPAS